MAEPTAPAIGFYQDVAGWTASPVSMGDHNACCILPAGSDNPVAGVRHASGENGAARPSSLIYIKGPDVDESVRRSGERGGKERVTGRMAGMGRFCIVEDPARAVAALYQPE